MGISLTDAVAAQVRAELKERDIPQRAIAALLGVSQAAVWRRLTGEVAFNTAELEKIAAYLDLSVAELIEQRAA